MTRINLTIPLNSHNSIIAVDGDLPHAMEGDWGKVPLVRIEITSIDHYHARFWLKEEIVDFLNGTDSLWYIDVQFDMNRDKYGVPYTRTTACLKYSSLEDNAVMLKLML